jgi:hypothetical protein
VGDALESADEIGAFEILFKWLAISFRFTVFEVVTNL